MPREPCRRGREPLVVEEIAVAGDDCFGICAVGERDEEIIAGVAHDRGR